MSTPPSQQAVPLSRAPGKKKLAVAIPGAVVSGVAWRAGLFEAITQFLMLALVAYALVGLIEVVAGGSLVRIAKQWDSLAGWKRFSISVVVIVGAFVLVGLLMPLAAKLLYG